VPDLVALARILHGHCGLLASIALFHPAWTLSGAAPLRRSTRISVVLATALISVTEVWGWCLYPGYRDGTKRRLLIRAFEMAQLFETKEHLAWFALALAWTGAVVALRGPVGLRRTARLCFALAAGLALTVGLLGSVVAAS
jgi:hypothetical protein